MPPLHAYALDLRGGRALALRALVGLSGDDAKSRTTWIHLAYPGEWKGHANGPFALDRAAFQSCISVFEAESNPLALDYEHASMRGTEAPAAGWVQALELRGDDLYALVEFTERGAGYVRAGEYRFCSGVFLFDQPDRESGKPIACALHSIALTNTPFIDGQRPIELTRAVVCAAPGGPMITKEKLLAALDAAESDEFTLEQAQALLASVEAMAVASGETKPDEPSDAPLADDPKPDDEETTVAPLADEVPPTEGEADMDAMQMAFARLTEMTGLDSAALLSALDANMDAVVSALKGNVGAEAASLAREAVSTALREAQVELSRYRAEEAARQRKAATVALTSAVDALVADGRVLPSQRGHWLKIAEKAGTPESFADITKDLPVVVPLGRTVSATPPSPSASQATDPVFKTDEEREVAQRLRTNMGITDPKKLARMVARHFDLTKAPAS